LSETFIQQLIIAKSIKKFRATFTRITQWMVLLS